MVYNRTCNKGKSVTYAKKRGHDIHSLNLALWRAPVRKVLHTLQTTANRFHNSSHLAHRFRSSDSAPQIKTRRAR